MALWDLKVIVNRYFEDDFDDKNQRADEQTYADDSSDDELSDEQAKLLALVDQTVPSLVVSVEKKMFKKKGLRHLVELEQLKGLDLEASQEES